MNYQTAIDTFIYGNLTSSSDLVTKSTGGIWNKRPNDGAQPPYTVFNTVSDRPMYTNENQFVMATVTIKVQAVILDQSPTLKPYADAMLDDIDSVMGSGMHLQITQNGWIFSVTRGSSVDLGPNVNQRPYRYRGYNYIVKARLVPS